MILESWNGASCLYGIHHVYTTCLIHLHPSIYICCVFFNGSLLAFFHLCLISIQFSGPSLTEIKFYGNFFPSILSLTFVQKLLTSSNHYSATFVLSLPCSAISKSVYTYKYIVKCMHAHMQITRRHIHKQAYT